MPGNASTGLYDSNQSGRSVAGTDRIAIEETTSTAESVADTCSTGCVAFGRLLRVCYPRVFRYTGLLDEPVKSKWNTMMPQITNILAEVVAVMACAQAMAPSPNRNADALE